MDIKIILLNTIIGLKNSKINIYTYKKTYLQQKCNEIQINLQFAKNDHFVHFHRLYERSTDI